MKQPVSTSWTWVDALYMAAPTWARYAAVLGNDAAMLADLVARYNYTASQVRCGGGMAGAQWTPHLRRRFLVPARSMQIAGVGLWNEQYGLFYRDPTYINATTPSGKKVGVGMRARLLSARRSCVDSGAASRCAGVLGPREWVGHRRLGTCAAVPAQELAVPHRVQQQACHHGGGTGRRAGTRWCVACWFGMSCRCRPSALVRIGPLPCHLVVAGMWRSSLADYAEYPNPESTATGLIAYGIGTGVLQGEAPPEACAAGAVRRLHPPASAWLLRRCAAVRHLRARCAARMAGSVYHRIPAQRVCGMVPGEQRSARNAHPGL